MPAKGMLPLDVALDEVRSALLDRGRLIRAVAAGRRKGATPSVVRAQLRPVALKSGDRLQLVTDDGARPHTRNVDWSDAGGAVDALLAEPFGNWHVETVDETLQLRVTKRGDAQLHRAVTATDRPATGAHDRPKEHLLDPGDPLFDVIGGTAAKRRQVDAFLRALDAVLDDDLPQPLRVVDLGCGNAYLTFAGYRYLTKVRGLTAELVGVDVREDQRVRNTELAAQLGWSEWVRFEAGTIAAAPVTGADVVLALHACDTATDEALARAVEWDARYVLAAPCCHHDLAAQLRDGAAPEPYSPLVRHGILRERFADVFTDALRAQLLRLHGYSVEVVEFIDSRHTPRNLLLRARRGGARPTEAQWADYARLVDEWHVTPHLATLLGDATATASAGAATSIAAATSTGAAVSAAPPAQDEAPASS